MTHQEESAVLEAVTAILIEHGPAAMPSAYAIIMNCAMQIEREQTLKAESHQRTADRQGYANGFKPKALRTRAGEVHLRTPQTRDYHDEEGRRLKDLVARYHKTAPGLASWLEENIPEALEVFAFPAAHRKRLRTNNGLERLNKEIKRRTRVAALFPNEASVLRLVSAVLSEISDDWETDRSYLNMKAR
jgi:transposase-like protein